MYVTTFYSFKGGVGRTMALVNVAVELAQRGRRVLAVDFDLEAPGLDTFDLRRPADTTPGVVDFVNSYLATGQAPHVGEYIFESPGMGLENGGLWIMPAGAHQDGYPNTLARIDWGTLYEHHDGYLLFEDLKEQWKEFIKPDYVLIDSRTGHTDIAGICTRQLPDAVVILFFPNAQNHRGLKKMVRDIRAAKIDLHFVMSNVPDLDDEDKILEDSISSFRRDLGFRRDPIVIHRYDSLSLLNQVIFSKERPRSRLAKEYHAMTAEIMRLNAEDRDGALDYLGNIRQIWRTGESHTPDEEQRHLDTIESNHSDDGQVLFHLGTSYADDGDLVEAEELFTRAIDAGYREPEAYLRRAFIVRSEYADADGASLDAMEVLGSEHASPAQIRRAVSIVTPEDLMRVADTPAVAALPPSEKVRIASALDRSEAQAVAAITILRPLVGGHLSPDELKRARHSMSLAAIALGRFSEAIQVIRDEEPALNEMNTVLAFNYGMALWGERGCVVVDPFLRVLETARSDPRQSPDPNYLQCLAVSRWAVGESEVAQEFARKAKHEMVTHGGRQFSCWCYLRVHASKFLEDTDDILRMIRGHDDVTPRFMKLEGHPTR